MPIIQIDNCIDDHPYTCHYEIIESVIVKVNTILNLQDDTSHVFFIKCQPNPQFCDYIKGKYKNVFFSPYINKRYHYYISTTTYDKHYDTIKHDDPSHLYVMHNVTDRIRTLTNTVFLTPLSHTRYIDADILPFSNEKVITQTPVYIVQGNFDKSRRDYAMLKRILDIDTNLPFKIKLVGRGPDKPAFANQYPDKLIIRENLEFVDYHREMQDGYGLLTLTRKSHCPGYYHTQMTSSVNYARAYGFHCVIDNDLQGIYHLSNAYTYSDEDTICTAFLDSLHTFYKIPIPTSTNVTVLTYHIECQDNWSIVEEQFEKKLKCRNNITFVTFCEMFFYYTRGACRRTPWVGIIHDPANTDSFFVGRNLLQNRNFLDSLWCCKGLFCMSESVKTWVLQTFKDLPFFVEVIYHPLSSKPLKLWNINKYKEDKRAYQIGNWLRVPYFIFKLRAPGITKLITPFKSRLINDYNRFKERDNVTVKPHEYFSVTRHTYIDDDNYYAIFEKGVVAIQLYASTCNNIIIECIKTNCPVLVNRLPEVEAYLGKDYPFFYKDMDDAAKKIVDIDLVQKTSQYLSELDKSFLSMNNVIDSINKQLDTL